VPLVLSLAACAAEAPTQQTPITPGEVAAAFAAVEGRTDGPPAATLAGADTRPGSDPNWPILTYLIAEADLKGSRIEEARHRFRDVSRWAASADAGSDAEGEWGGSGLAVVSLWRWLQLLESADGPPQELEEVFEVADRLQQTRFFAGMVRSGALPALPFLEEEIARSLSKLAWRLHRPDALQLFLEFVSIDSTAELDNVERALAGRLIEEGLISTERLLLFRARRQLDRIQSTRRKEAAAEILWDLWSDTATSEDVRAEAGYEWSRFYRRSRERKPQVLAVLGSILETSPRNGQLTEKTLYLRGMIENSVVPKQPDVFFADLSILVERFPNRRLGDDALYQLASEHLFGEPADVDRALAEFARLRQFEGPNDWRDSAYLLPAIALVERGGDADLEAADSLLEEYLAAYPDGPFRLRSLFWRGRIAERAGDLASSRRIFEEVIAEAPYDFYGLRAAFHLELGSDASSTVVLPPSSALRNRIREAFRRSEPTSSLSVRSRYHARVETADRSGLFQRVLPVVDGLGRRFRNRVDQIPLDQLDEAGLIPPVALLLSLRQDVFAARDAEPSGDNRLRLAGLVGPHLADWPLAIALTEIRGSASHSALTDLQSHDRYLATAYPEADRVGRLEEILSEAAWEMEDSRSLALSLMYAIIRRESSYFPGAISPAGALGLFQVMPRTFEDKPSCWSPQEGTPTPTPTSHLFDPARNVAFWSCLAQSEFRPHGREDIPVLLLKHHAGAGHLAEWTRRWEGRQLEGDLEMQIEFYRFPATRAFVRHVLSDLTIIDASGMFEELKPPSLAGET
jgi:tetratricopeptide (TPR) repeat protein